MKDKQLILRLLAFYLLEENKTQGQIRYEGNMNSFLSDSMKYVKKKLDDQSIDDFKKKFKVAMEKANHLMGNDSFRFESTKKNKRRINMGLFEAISYCLMKLDYDQVEDNVLKDKLTELKKYLDDKQLCGSGSDSRDKVNERFKQAKNIILHGRPIDGKQTTDKKL